MAGTDDPLKQLNTALNYLELLSKQDLTGLQKKVYSSFSAMSYLVLEGKKSEFKDGWSQNILDTAGKPLFTEDEMKTVESVGLFMKPYFQKQEGGSSHIALKPFSTRGMIESSKLSTPSMPSMSPDDISLDKTYWKVKDYIAGLDKQTHDLSRELGPYRFFYDMPTDIRIPIPVPFPPYTVLVPLSPRAIPVLISVFVEAIRLLFSFGPLSTNITRKLLSIVVAVTDLLQGNWKQGILSLLGYFGTIPLLLGIVGKVFLNAFSLIAPDIQESLIFDMYKSTKSFSIGIPLWAFTTFAPDFIRKIVRTQFDILKGLVEKANGQIETIEGAMQKSLDPVGLKIKFHEIPPDFVPSFDDIQNLQSIARQPAIFCSKEFQQAIEPLNMIPPIRLILEMLNIPTDPQTVALECKGLAGSSITNTLENTVMPEITMNPDSPLAQMAKKAEGLTGIPDLGDEGLDPRDRQSVPPYPVPGISTDALKSKLPGMPGMPTSTDGMMGALKSKLPEGMPGMPTSTDGMMGALKSMPQPKMPKLAKTLKGGSRKKRITRRVRV